MGINFGQVSGTYIGLDEAALLTMRTQVLAELANARQGKRFNSVSGGGKAFQKDNMNFDDLRTDLAEINYALQLLDPSTYGKAVTRLVPDFSRNSQNLASRASTDFPIEP